MFRFIIPFPDGTVWDVPIGAQDLDGAFEQYRRYWWNPLTTGAIGVWHNHALVTRVLPEFDPDTEENLPKLEPWP
jgi:hypothetical protein